MKFHRINEYDFYYVEFLYNDGYVAETFLIQKGRNPVEYIEARMNDDWTNAKTGRKSNFTKYEFTKLEQNAKDGNLHG
jgi:hypothetical protein